MNIIRKAMQNLPGHWYQGSLWDGGENYCGLGHVSVVAGSAVEYMDATHIMHKVANEQYPDRTNKKENFALFNDHPLTTEEEVLRVMEKAAIQLDERV